MQQYATSFFMTVMVVLYTNFTDYKYRSTKEKKQGRKQLNY